MIDDPFTGPAVAGLATAGVCALTLAVGSRLGRRWPTMAAPIVAVALCWPLAEAPPARFLNGDTWSYSTGVTAAVALGMTAFALAAREARNDDRRRWLAAAAAAVAVGAFLCIPETGLLRLAPAPLTVAAAAVATRRIRPIGPAAAVAAAAAVVWLALVGGTSRPTSLFGLSAGLALAAAATIVPATPIGGRFGAAAPLGVAIAAAGVARIAGTTQSSALAALLTTASLGAVGVAQAAARPGTAPLRMDSEQLEGPQRQ